jgi:hypothetical protein
VRRKILVPGKEEITGDWRRQHNEKLYDLYSSPNIIRTIKSGRKRWVGHATRMGESSCVYRVLVGKHEGKRPLAEPEHTKR